MIKKYFILVKPSGFFDSQDKERPTNLAAFMRNIV